MRVRRSEAVLPWSSAGPGSPAAQAGALVAATPAAVAAVAAATPRRGAASGDASPVLAAAGSGSRVGATGSEPSGWTPVDFGVGSSGASAADLRLVSVVWASVASASWARSSSSGSTSGAGVGTAVTAGWATMWSNTRPSGARRNSTGVAHSAAYSAMRALRRAGGGLVDGEPVGQRAVELAGERGGRAVADGELHGDDGGAVLLDQALRHPAERVGAVDAGGLAGVEQDQPQRVVVAQVGAEDGRADLGAAPVPVLEVDDAVLDPVVVVAVADEVQDVDVVLPQPGRQGLDRRRRSAGRSSRCPGRPRSARASCTRRHSASTSSSGRSVGEEMTTRMRSASVDGRAAAAAAATSR